MRICDNAFCSNEIKECDSIALAGQQFCCSACAEDWQRQNEALIEMAAPFHSPAYGFDAAFRKRNEASRRRDIP
jgi:hypothetical protein